MTPRQPKRRRGVVLTPSSRQKLQRAIKAWEEQDNFSEKFTIEELSDRTKLDAGTVSKVLDCEEGVDRRTLERFFSAFSLELTQEDYVKPNPSAKRLPTRDDRVDWGEAVDVSIFYGRRVELETLEHWIVSDHCRLIVLLGMGGIGKTSLAAKLGEKIQAEFDYVVWRSLREAPPLRDILLGLIQFLSNQQQTEADLPESMGGRITKLLEYLRIQRCLLILDNAESLLQEGQAGVYREGYEGYEELLRRVGESSHQSCLLVTSREKPRGLSAMEGEAFLVRSLQLHGVAGSACQEILRAKGLHVSETDNQGDELNHRCAGNPLALKLVATTIQDLFNGNIAEFLSQETIVFEGVRDLLDQQFQRLSELEKSIMYWLTINREPASVQELQEDIVPPITKSRLLEAVKGLLGRSLVERTITNFTQQPVVMEYITEKLIEQVCEEIRIQKILLFDTHSLIKATSKEYVREIQTRVILSAVANRLLAAFGCVSNVDEQLTKILIGLRKQLRHKTGYTSGNILNLLCQQKISLDGRDFSDVTIRQAYLQGVDLRCVDFSRSTLIRSIFTETFGIVLSVAFSPDGSLLLSGDTSGKIYIWRVADGQLLMTLHGHKDWILSVSFSSDGQILASSSDDQTVKLWDVRTGCCLKTLQGHTNWVWSVALNSSDQILASGSHDQMIKLWDVYTGKCIKTLQGHTDKVCSVAFSPNSQALVSGSYDKMIRLWNVSSGKYVRTFEGHTDCVRSVIFSLDNEKFVSGSDDQTIKIWDVCTGQCVETLQGHADRVWSLALSPDGKTLASGSCDQTIKLWNISTGQHIKTLRGHTNWVRSVAFSPDGKTLVSSSEDHTVRIWDISTSQCFKTLQGYTNWVRSVAFNSNASMIAGGCEDTTIRLWNASTGQHIKTLRGHTNWVRSVAFSPDGKTLVSSSEDHTVRIWDISTSQCVKALRGHTSWVRSVALSPDGELLVSGSDDRTVRIWNTGTGQCIKVLQGHTNWVRSVAFSPVGTVVASGSNDRTIKIWNVHLGHCIRTIEGHTDGLGTVAFSSDGTLLASGSDDKIIKLWNSYTGECIKTITGHQSGVRSVVFVYNNQMIVSSGGNDRTVKLWDSYTGKCIATLQEHTDWVEAVASNQDGSIFASTSKDGTILIWDLRIGERIKTLRISRPYENLRITQAKGLTKAQKESLIALGAVELD